MNDIAIDVKDVTIRFNLASEKIDNLKEYFVKLIKHELLFQEFLAVRDASFTIRKGEAWALVGSNGSGKSTLLKAISGILKPYKGEIVVNGTISPLLELGAGFDMNLTARENIFLNGTVLGHSKKYMQEHFDEIVEFSELHKFLDSPVKNFSSGMRARLGFSIATIVRPDILIVDETPASSALKTPILSTHRLLSLRSYRCTSQSQVPQTEQHPKCTPTIRFPCQHTV